MRSFLQVKCICMVRTFHKEYSYWQMLMHKYMSMQLLQPINIHPYFTETFQMPSISTRTTLRLCTNPICQQRGFILDKQQWRVVQHHELLTHHIAYQQYTVINANILSCIIHQLNINKCMTIEYLSLFVSWVNSFLSLQLHRLLHS